MNVAPDKVDAGGVPLVIDLDGTLIRTDLLHEATIKLLRRTPHLALALPAWLLDGKAALKRRLSDRVAIDVETLPYNDELLAWIRQEREAGRRVVLCTASDERYAQAVAKHLGVFDEVIGSDGTTNNSARRKADELVRRFGAGGFDYAGNSHDDLPVWGQSRRAIVVDAKPALRAKAQRGATVEREMHSPAATWRTWLRAMRLHQWLKNLLVLLPLAGAHRFTDWALLQQALLAFLAFGFTASAVYVINDLVDVESDRAHPRKRQRPFASGQLSVVDGVLMATVLLVLGGSIAALGRPAFAAALAAYVVLTFAYSVWLKRKVLVDCIVLGALYTLRIVAGWLAVGLPHSFWLLSFSLFLFLSLAFVKRYAELHAYAAAGRPDAHGRGYLANDLPLVQSMGIAAGFSSVMLLALYINGDTVLQRYSHPEVLWLLLPIHLYWISRMWMQAQRGNMDDDPVIFALRDRFSLACGVLFICVLWAGR